MTFIQCINRLIRREGGLRRAAKVMHIDPGYLSRLRHARKRHPSDRTLKKLGIYMVTEYWINGKPT